MDKNVKLNSRRLDRFIKNYGYNGKGHNAFRFNAIAPVKP